MNDNWLICSICGKALNRAGNKSCLRCALADKNETGYRDKANAGDASAQAEYAYCLIYGKNVIQNKYLAIVKRLINSTVYLTGASVGAWI